MKIYAKIVKATTTDNFTKSISTLPITPGNSIGRSCHTIRTEAINALIKIIIRFEFIVCLLVYTTHGNIFEEEKEIEKERPDIRAAF